MKAWGAEVVFKIEAVELNRQLWILNAGGYFCIDRLNAQVRVYDVELDFGTDGSFALTKAGPVQKAGQGGKIRSHLGCKTVKVFRCKFRLFYRQAHSGWSPAPTYLDSSGNSRERCAGHESPTILSNSAVTVSDEYDEGAR